MLIAPEKYTVNQGCMSVNLFLEYGRHVARLRRRRRRRRRRAYASTSNTASHDNHEKIHHEFPFLSRDDYGAPLGGSSGRRSSAINLFIALVFVSFSLNFSSSSFLICVILSILNYPCSFIVHYYLFGVLLYNDGMTNLLKNLVCVY